ncbi:MAG: L,D-transpeptidase [Hyphomicrobium sp.]
MAPRFGRPLLSATLALIGMAATTGPAAAQDLFSFLWGGGSRETVAFDPRQSPRQIIVSFGDRKLYWVHKKGEAISYPIAVPRAQSRWQGVTSVSSKQVNPAWTPTPEMRRENPRLPNWVPGGHPMNPLGVRALYLGASMYRIHGTDAPWTIGTAASKGCIRMYNEDVLDLYQRVPIGTKVTVTWKNFG